LKKHQKHTNLVRRNNEIFAPNEVTFLGSNCGTISNLVQGISKKLNHFSLAYFDASHSKEAIPNALSEYVFHHEGNVAISSTGSINKFQQRLDFANYDLVFVNGNHYKGSKQILILDEAKEASVLKRIEQLDDIQFIIKLKPETEIFSFLIEKYPTIVEKPIYLIDDIDAISNHVKTIIQDKIATVKGLVLVGGKSTRMGSNKAQLNYYGKPQKEAVKILLEKCSLQTFYSVGYDENTSANTDEISDKFINLGPFGGICSAFQKDPNSAWLVMATDLPFVDEQLIQLLLEKRNPSKAATAIKGKNKEFPEPLITIYEPKAYPILLQYLAQGYSCPRKMVINSDVEIIEIEDRLIRNVNTPEEFQKAKEEIENI
jgi:molybdopterin-guanine dinucleotide biosynthesis protein A